MIVFYIHDHKSIRQYQIVENATKNKKISG